VSATPLSRVTVYHALGCHLCDRAIEVAQEAQAAVPFELVLVDITEDDELEAAFRELLPVIEINGERAFVHFVSVAALIDRLRSDGSPYGAERTPGSM
jgi:glutaredoxin